MSESKKIIKIQHLLAKAGSTDSPQEAEALFVKAQELMVKWRIEESQLEEQQETNIEQNDVSCFKRKLEGNWELKLAGALCRPNGCDYTYGKHSQRIILYGAAKDVELVKYFIETTRETFRRIARKEYSALLKKYGKHDPDLPKKNKYIRSFLLGACAGLADKMERMTRYTVQQTDGVDAQSYGLIVRTALEKVENHIMENVAVKVVKSRTHVGDLSAFSNGVKTGKNHSLHIPVSTTKSNNPNTEKLC